MNTIVDKTAIATFNENISFLYPADSYKILYLEDNADFTDFDSYTHLLISGSELSASKQLPTDFDILRIIRHFVDAGKSVYGICYGHQMLARAIVGDKACRRAEVPEFGWHRTELNCTDPLFEGIVNPVFAQSHYDEVCNLTDDFTILAHSEVCEVSAFRYKDLNIWGTQFHPEVTYKNGENMRVNNMKTEEAAQRLSRNDLENAAQLEQNYLIFSNFYQTR
jgi:GMP synthase (glutamine-hydrolysing)